MLIQSVFCSHSRSDHFHHHFFLLSIRTFYLPPHSFSVFTRSGSKLWENGWESHKSHAIFIINEQLQFYAILTSSFFCSVAVVVANVRQKKCILKISFVIKIWMWKTTLEQFECAHLIYILCSDMLTVKIESSWFHFIITRNQIQQSATEDEKWK